MIDGADFSDRLRRAVDYMGRRSGMLLLCEEWLPERAGRIAIEFGLHSEIHMTGMVTGTVLPPFRQLPALEYRRVENQQTREAISDINAIAYGLAPELCRAPCAAPELWTPDSFGFVAYLDGRPVSTAAVRAIDHCLYVYMVATLPAEQRRGYAEAVMRHALDCGRKATGLSRTTLHASDDGFPIYQRMGYRTAAHFTGYTPESSAGPPDPASTP